MLCPSAVVTEDGRLGWLLACFVTQGGDDATQNGDRRHEQEVQNRHRDFVRVRGQWPLRRRAGSGHGALPTQYGVQVQEGPLPCP